MSKTIWRFGAAVVACGIAIQAPGALRAQETATIATNVPRIDFPAGLATDGMVIYVANGRNNTIDKIDLTAHSLSQIAGTLFKQGSSDGIGAAALFNDPSGVALIGSDLYVVDSNNSVLRLVKVLTGAVTTVAGATNIPGTDDGKGSNAHFNIPSQLAADPNGSRLFLTDSGSSTIRMITVPDMIVKTIAGQPQTEGKVDGPATKSEFDRPRGIATDGKFVYVSDTGNGIIRKIDLSSMITTTIAGTGEEGNADGAGAQAQFNNAGAMATDGTTLYVLDADNHAIRKINLATNEVSTVTLVNGHIGSGCTMSKDGHLLYFSDTTENSVQQVETGNGNVTAVFPLGS